MPEDRLSPEAVERLKDLCARLDACEDVLDVLAIVRSDFPELIPR